ncbi:MAG: hypothetical protein EKK39_08760 [Sphingobacteriales bacterium]|uniref:hypothetical protein n=1 Tax=Hydrotalea flava TaxID=714549 RepID=UPI00082C9A05|nr:hypothetical protein [Hydrotalea flava]RTL51007.1 MAG: hypothetical protein EKK39_08760 [Sphingobacteriales bacterium]
MLYLQPWFKQEKFCKKIRFAKLVLTITEQIIQQKYEFPVGDMAAASDSIIWNYSMLKSRFMYKGFWTDLSPCSSNERYIQKLVPYIIEELNPYLSDDELVEQFSRVAF